MFARRSFCSSLFLCFANFYILVKGQFGDDLKYEQQALDFHNQLRAKHHVPPLTTNATLHGMAMKCAMYYAGQRMGDHTCPFKTVPWSMTGAKTGENLSGGMRNPDDPMVLSDFVQLTMDMWSGEESSHNFQDNNFDFRSGHFTQMVWKSTTQLGFAVLSSNGYTAGVGLYYPAGNMQGAFLANVFAP